MTTFELITQWATIISPIIAVALAWWTVRSSNKSTRQMLRSTRENSRVTSSEHLSLYRTEAFYNEVYIRNLSYDIQVKGKQLAEESDEKKKKEISDELQKLRMNLQFMQIRRTQLLHSDFALQRELQDLFKDFA